MRSEEVQVGMFVQVHEGSREADLRARLGIVRRRLGNHSYAPFEVQFENSKQMELLWASEFEEW